MLCTREEDDLKIIRFKLPESSDERRCSNQYWFKGKEDLQTFEEELRLSKKVFHKVIKCFDIDGYDTRNASCRRFQIYRGLTSRRDRIRLSSKGKGGQSVDMASTTFTGFFYGLHTVSNVKGQG